MIQESVEKLGPLTVMIANAGIAQVQPMLEISDDDFTKMMVCSLQNQCRVD